MVQAASLKRTDGIGSCGCANVESIIARNTKHGHTTNGISPTYHSWAGMKARCLNPSHSHYRYYGERGITVCDRWQSFATFLADMGKKPRGRSLDRIDNDGPYSPENCHWATPKEQARNKRNSRLLTKDGVTKTIAEWSELLSIHPATISDRLQHRRTDIEALSVKKPSRRHLRPKNRS
jgi:hypothetical protein